MSTPLEDALHMIDLANQGMFGSANEEVKRKNEEVIKNVLGFNKSTVYTGTGSKFDAEIIKASNGGSSKSSKKKSSSSLASGYYPDGYMPGQNGLTIINLTTPNGESLNVPQSIVGSGGGLPAINMELVVKGVTILVGLKMLDIIGSMFTRK